MANVVFAAYTAVMRAVQGTFDTVQNDVDTCATMTLLYLRTEVTQQRLDIAPVNISAGRFLENHRKQTLVFVTHNSCPVEQLL